MSSSGGEMTNAQLFQQMALLQWLSSQTDEDRRVLAAVTGVQVGRELLNRISGQHQVDAFKVLLIRDSHLHCSECVCLFFYALVLILCLCFLQRECILGISEFVRQNPQASQAVINAEVEKRVLTFAAKVKALDAAPLL
ncbi:hypothetical protein JOB18_013762 [Solea senegalensis]|uniref:Uncharacterized protein n=1 Tax=Solea senegalensis TaxID=28829 RepID=A0AAV6QGT9_SOLSE|nr:hypothetical protein JOB18_013762 [Solea senegalensis]